MALGWLKIAKKTMSSILSDTSTGTTNMGILDIYEYNSD